MPEHIQILKFVVAVVCVGLLSAFVYANADNQMPFYQGKPLDRYFAKLDSGSEFEQAEARQAFNVLGEKSLPFLLAQIESDRPKMLEPLKGWLDRKVFHHLPMPSRCGFEKSIEASWKSQRLSVAFEILGDQAGPAVGRLGKLAHVPECQSFAIISLASTGAAASNEVAKILSGTNADLRNVMVSALGCLTKEKNRVVSVVLPEMNDGDGEVRQAAAYSLGKLHSRPLESVAALTAALGDSDSTVRYISLYALTNFGIAARSAIPAVRRLASDPVQNVRDGSIEIARYFESFEQPNAGAKDFTAQ